MAFFYQKQDPIKETIDTVLSQWDYGQNRRHVYQQWYNFLDQYPQFELSAEYFTYGGMSSGSKLVFLRGIMILAIENEQHEVPLHFILISGFPGVAPKAYLSSEPNEDVISSNPYILKNNEILNQYMNKWQGFHVSYNLNTMYYYIYQSFLLSPPVKSSITGDITSEENKKQDNDEEWETFPEATQQQPENRGSRETSTDKDFQRVMVTSKVQDVINKMTKIADELEWYSDKVHTRNAIVSSKVEKLEQELEHFEEIMDSGDDNLLSDIDQIVKPEDEVAEQILDNLAQEKACEEIMDLVRGQFRKKKISLDEYLETVRTLSEEQFMAMAKRRKVMSLVNAYKR